MKQEEPETLRALYEKKKLPLLLGANDFIDDIKQKYFDKTIIKEIPQVKELFLDKSRIEKAVCRFYQIEVDDLLKSRCGNYNEARNVAICLLRKHTGASLQNISSNFEMNSYSSVGIVIMRIKQAIARDKKPQQRITAVERVLT